PHPSAELEALEGGDRARLDRRRIEGRFLQLLAPLLRREGDEPHLDNESDHGPTVSLHVIHQLSRQPAELSPDLLRVLEVLLERSLAPDTLRDPGIGAHLRVALS